MSKAIRFTDSRMSKKYNINPEAVAMSIVSDEDIYVVFNNGRALDIVCEYDSSTWSVRVSEEQFKELAKIFNNLGE